MENQIVSGHKTLLQKYEIPLDHLDYEYLKQCKNVKEIERIIRILRSGEEGYFPDLCKFAENKLKELNPQSKILRTESVLLNRYNMNDDEFMEIHEDIKKWHEDMKSANQTLRNDANNDRKIVRNIPPVRALNSNILQHHDKNANTGNGVKKDRIKSQEYHKWDKYDADAEALKIDLDEERKLESIKLQNKKNHHTAVIEEIYEDDVSQMSDMEKQMLAKRYKDKGNDHFRAKEFDYAIEQYTTSIRIYPFATTHNNRAIAYIKLHKYLKAIDDCNQCLKMDPNNIKALLRKAEALKGLDKRRDAYDVYCNILLLDASNKAALEASNDLRKQLPDLPLPNSTRIKIIEEEQISKSNDTDKGCVGKLSNKIIPNAKETLTVPVSNTVQNKLEHKHDTKVSKLGVLEPQETALKTFKQKLQEDKKKRNKYKEHLKEIFQSNDDIFLLPHHDTRNKTEFIIEESKI